MAIQQLLASYGGSAPGAGNTVALVHADGTNGSTSFPDDTGKTWTAFGNAQVSTTSARFGTGCLLLDGAGDYLESQTSADFGFGSGDFCIEGFVRPNTLTTNQIMFGLGGVWFFYYNNSGLIFVFNGSTNVLTTGTAQMTIGTYSHVAWCREGSTMRMYANGNLLGSATNTTSFGTSNYITVGRRVSTNSDFLNGRVDEIRVSRVPRYTASTYTVPTAPFTLD